MSPSWYFISLFLLLSLHVKSEGNEEPYFKDDPVKQAELERLIELALNRDRNQNPGKTEYERFYNVRKFIMENSKKPEDADRLVIRKDFKRS